MRYDDRIIDEIQSSTDIVEIITPYVPLKRSGKNFKGLCPFHGEKTPSFMVQPEKQIFHCFGCGVGGNVYSFLMKYENMSFPETVRHLAERANIRLPEPTGHNAEQTSENEKLYEVYKLAENFFHQLFLDQHRGKKARDYFLSRHFQMPNSDELKMGYCLDEWRALFDYLCKKGYSTELLVKSGLVHRSPKGNFYDAFRGRLLFPIKNNQGKTVAFGGRILGKTEGPKYLNSPENPIFHKRRELFGLYLAKKNISKEKPQILVVEGYFDFLRLYQNGFQATVATLGTSLTEGHVKLLKRYVEEAVVIYDGDGAGQAASIRGLEVFLEGGMNVKLVKLPEGYDPDDFVQKKGAEAFQKLIDDAQDFFDFKLQNLFERYNRTESLGLMKITNDFLETFMKIKNDILLDRYIRRLAAALGIDEVSIKRELGKLQERFKRKDSGLPEAEPSGPQGPKKFTDDVLLVSLALDDDHARKRIMEEVSETEVEEEWARELLRAMNLNPEMAQSLSLSQFLNKLTNENARRMLLELAAMEWSSETREKALEDILTRIHKKKTSNRLKELRRRISLAEHEGDVDSLSRYAREYQELMKRP